MENTASVLPRDVDPIWGADEKSDADCDSEEGKPGGLIFWFAEADDRAFRPICHNPIAGNVARGGQRLWRFAPLGSAFGHCGRV